MATLIFLCNGDAGYISTAGQTITNKQLPDEVKPVLSSGMVYETNWSCWNSTKVNVGDRAYLKRSGDHLRGFIAAGYVVAAPKKQQLRLRGGKYLNLSEAYVGDDNGCLYVLLHLDSIVDFDYPLKQDSLIQIPQFKKTLKSARGGVELNPEAALLLEAAWEEHSLKMQRLGHGRRLVDVLLEQGNEYKRQRNYQAAIDAYEFALKVNPNYSKALNAINDCRLALQREKFRFTSTEKHRLSPSFSPVGLSKFEKKEKQNSTKPFEVISPEELPVSDESIFSSIPPEPSDARSFGAGFGSLENNRKVEQAAIDEVKMDYEKKGWTVQSVERERCGYDLLCTNGKEVEHAEVKGFSGVEPRFIITAGEVRKAEKDSKFVLWVVTSALKNPVSKRYSHEEFFNCFELKIKHYWARPRNSLIDFPED